MSRKIFNYDNMDESRIVNGLQDVKNLFKHSISACGILFFRNGADGKELLLITYTDPFRTKLDDFGGKIDETDDSVMAGMIRETTEETNGVINEKIISNVLSKSPPNIFYTQQSKYYLYIIEVSNDFFPDTNVFGNFENVDKKSRTVAWHKYVDCKNDLAFRLSKNKQVMSFLEN